MGMSSAWFSVMVLVLSSCFRSFGYITWQGRPFGFRLHAADNGVETKEEVKYSVRMLNSLDEISRETWNALLPVAEDEKADSCCPFLQYDWLNSLEKSGCVKQQRGWQPLHIVIYLEDNNNSKRTEDQPASEEDIVAAMPLYVKYHSQGEFIFDHSWADFAQRILRIKYYPKLLSAIPMTPASSTKLLFNTKKLHTIVGADESSGSDLSEVLDKQRLKVGMLLGSFLKQLSADNEISSVNVNFMKAEEVPVFKAIDYSLRETIQYRFTNVNNITNQPFSDFNDYLNSFKSKRRIKIKAERRKVYEDQSITVKVINGADKEADAAFYRTMFELYTTTVEKMWGSQYLSQDFFELLHTCPDSFKRHLVFIVAYDKDGTLVAGTINAASVSHFYGRYWGAYKFMDNLHFEVCYYKAIEYCIDNGIKYMEPGAGGGSFKFLRGFDPYIVNSVHWFNNVELSMAVEDFLKQERTINQATKDELLEMSVNKKSLGPQVAKKTTD